MAFNTVSKLLLDSARGISPSNPADSKDPLGAVGESARNILSQTNPKDLMRRVQIENALYDQVNRFKCPEDLNDQAVAQWFKYDKNHNVDNFYHPMRQVTNRAFDEKRYRNDDSGGGHNLFTIEWQSGVKFIKVSDFGANEGGVVLNRMDSLTDNGTWNVFGNVVNLSTDNLNYVSGNGSIRMDINSSSGTGGIVCTGMTPADISSYFVQGKVFTWIDLPNLNQLQTVTLDLMSSADDYYSITVNSPHDTQAFQLGWNLMGFPFDLSVMNIFGTPDPKAINAVRITMVTNGTLLMNNVRIDNIIMRRGKAYGIQYVSDSMFEDAQTGIWTQEPTDPSNLIHLDNDTYKILLSELKVVLAGELFTSSVASTKKFLSLQQQRDTDLKMYKRQNKEEIIDEQQQFYNFGVPYGYGRRGNGGHDHHAPIVPPM